MAKRKDMGEATCKMCGAPFERTTKHRVYCSADCAMRYKNEVYLPEYSRAYRAEFGDAINAQKRMYYAMYVKGRRHGKEVLA